MEKLLCKQSFDDFEVKLFKWYYNLCENLKDNVSLDPEVMDASANLQSYFLILNNLNGEKNILIDQLNIIQGEIDELESQISDSQNQIDSLTLSITNKETEIDNLIISEEYTQEEKDIILINLNGDLNALNSSLSTQIAYKNDLESQKDDKNTEKDNKNSEISLKDIEIASAQSDYDNSLNTYNSIFSQESSEIESNYITMINEKIRNEVSIQNTIYGPNIINIDNENYHDAIQIYNIRIDEEWSSKCEITCEELTSNINIIFISFSLQISNYFLYVLSKWFESQISLNENITDWIADHIVVDQIGTSYLKFTLINMTGKTLPTYENLSAYTIPLFGSIMAQHNASSPLQSINPISKMIMNSAHLLERDKILQLASAIKSLTTTMTSSFATVNAALTSLSTRITSLEGRVTTLEG